jgi:hypothetical protein
VGRGKIPHVRRADTTNLELQRSEDGPHLGKMRPILGKNKNTTQKRNSKEAHMEGPYPQWLCPLRSSDARQGTRCAARIAVRARTACRSTCASATRGFSRLEMHQAAGKTWMLGGEVGPAKWRAALPNAATLTLHAGILMAAATGLGPRRRAKPRKTLQQASAWKWLQQQHPSPLWIELLRFPKNMQLAPWC